VQNMAQSTRQTFGVPSQGVLIESDKVVRLLSEARYAYETRLWELEIHAFEATGNHHAHHS
jgi:hypothetical protein